MKRRGRGTGGGREGEKGKSKKRLTERERGVKEQRLHVAVEEMIWIWRGINSQVRPNFPETQHR